MALTLKSARWICNDRIHLIFIQVSTEKQHRCMIHGLCMITYVRHGILLPPGGQIWQHNGMVFYYHLVARSGSTTTPHSPVNLFFASRQCGWRWRLESFRDLAMAWIRLRTGPDRQDRSSFWAGQAFINVHDQYSHFMTLETSSLCEMSIKLTPCAPFCNDLNGPLTLQS